MDDNADGRQVEDVITQDDDPLEDLGIRDFDKVLEELGEPPEFQEGDELPVIVQRGQIRRAVWYVRAYETLLESYGQLVAWGRDRVDDIRASEQAIHVLRAQRRTLRVVAGIASIGFFAIGTLFGLRIA